jgi:sugar O-acyltransferase (sialic acid O-acetyltransferase NeuD family)
MHRGRKKIVFIGAIGTGLNIIEQVADARDNFNYPADTEGILLDSFEKGIMVSGVPVIGSLKDIPRLLKQDELLFLFVLFKPEKLRERYELLQSLKIPLSRFTNFFHPMSYISESADYGTGNVILSNSTIQSKVTIGNFNIINSNVTLEHDTIIGNGNFFAAGSVAGSKVTLGNHCFVGLNASIRENIILGDNVFTGMQSTVLRNYDNVIIGGSPAKPLNKIKE